MGHTIYAQHRAPPPRTKFMHTKYIYRDDFNLHIGIKENDAFNRCARYKNTKHYTIWCSACVLVAFMSLCVCVSVCPEYAYMRLGTGFSVQPIVSKLNVRQFRCKSIPFAPCKNRTIQCKKMKLNSKWKHTPVADVHDSQLYATIQDIFENILLACDTLRSTLNFFSLR